MNNVDPKLIILCLGITLALAYFVKRLVNRFRIPDVTGFVLFGVLLGQVVFKDNLPFLDSLDLVSDFSLGIIAFIIGHELKGSVIKSLGKTIFFITIFESISAFLLVTGGLYFSGFVAFDEALLLGAVASATAPAATVYVIQQYKSKGPLTSTILAVVGIDDAIALMIYVFASNLASSHFSHLPLSVTAVLVKPLLDILLSLLIGIVGGYTFRQLFRKSRNNDYMTMGIVSYIILIMGLAECLHCSELLAIMSFSCYITNTSPVLSKRSASIIEYFSPVLLPLFFIFAGAHLDVRLIPAVGGISLLFTLLRGVGKIGGAATGAYLGKASAAVRKYTGFGLIPQVGVAVALAIAIKKQFGDPGGIYGTAGAEMAIIIINILLTSTIITEIVGPVLTRYSLIKSGEATVT